MPNLQADTQLLVQAIQAPLLGVLAWLLYALKRGLLMPPTEHAPAPHAPSSHERADHGRAVTERESDRIAADRIASDRAALERTRDDLAAFKLEVARTYVPLSLIRDVDSRLTAQLIRIEQKLDEATRAAHSTAAQLRVMTEDR